MTNLNKITITDEMETIGILRKAAAANRHLAELKGISKIIPNESVLLNSIFTQEAKDSSAIENIVTTNDELYKERLFGNIISNPAVKEIEHYIEALNAGFKIVRSSDMLTVNHICKIQSILENNNAGIRSQKGTKLINASTNTVVYEPPQSYEEILDLLKDLESFINDDSRSRELDPLIKMAVIHYQFESIHPFFDGNGRTGRIINVLYLVLKKLLDIPVLYLSRYIIEHKQDYYSLFQEVRTAGSWEKWILFMLEAVIETSKYTSEMVKNISEAMKEVKKQIREQYRFYSQDLINALFYMPYTKIEFIQNQLKISRKTASEYLKKLCEGKILKKHRIGRSNYYINTRLYNILTETPPEPPQGTDIIESVT